MDWHIGSRLRIVCEELEALASAGSFLMEDLNVDTAPVTSVALGEEPDLTGRWAICSRGRIGRIEGRETLSWGLSWVGTGADGSPWSSRNPTLICADDALLIERHLGLPSDPRSAHQVPDLDAPSINLTVLPPTFRVSFSFGEEG